LSVTTFLTPAERSRVDAAGVGSYRAIHRDGVSELVGDIKAKRADVVLVSVARCDGPVQPRISAMVREFPRVSAVALFSGAAPDAPRLALSLGSSGITQLVDVREPHGWHELRRTLLNSRGSEIQREALSQLSIDLAGVDPECWTFFESLFLAPPKLSTVRQLSVQLVVLPSTLMSRFFRSALPTPKRYLAEARLVRAARLFENPGFSIANVSNHLDYSSPQSFGRHVRTLLDLTATRFRDRFDGAGMLQHFRETLVLPYLPTLRHLRPLGSVALPGLPPASHRVH
ncbi:MAG: helix-turn-helix domain-containing protein, partial [Gemmatimonadaceae bacterium]